MLNSWRIFQIDKNMQAIGKVEVSVSIPHWFYTMHAQSVITNSKMVEIQFWANDSATQGIKMCHKYKKQDNSWKIVHLIMIIIQKSHPLASVLKTYPSLPFMTDHPRTLCRLLCQFETLQKTIGRNTAVVICE